MSRPAGSFLPERIVAFYRGWCAYARSHHGAEAGYWVVVDDLCHADIKPDQFSSQQDVQQALTRLIADCEAAPAPVGLTDVHHRYTLAKLRQSAIYLSDLEQPPKAVAPLDFDRYGVERRRLTESDLKQLQTTAKASRAAADAALAARGNDPKAYFSVAIDADAAAKHIDRSGVAWLEAFRKAYAQLKPPGYDSVPTSLDAPFQNLVVYADRRIKLLLNRKMQAAFTRAHIDFLALHEICGHIQHFAQLLADDQLQRSAPHLLCFNLHNVDAFVLEGVAQVMSVLALDTLGGAHPEVAAQLDAANLFVAVRHAGLMDVLEGRGTVDQAAERHAAWLGGDAAAARGVYLGKLAFRHTAVQALNYYTSFEALRPFLALDASKRRQGLTALMRAYPTPDDTPGFLRGVGVA